MDKIKTFAFGDNFIESCADYILANFSEGNTDLSRLACVFGGKRPALFVRRALARRIKKPFYPPRVFSIDEFMSYTVDSRVPLPRLSDLDAAYIVFTIAQKLAPEILTGRAAFSEFLPWAREITSFIEQLDLDDIKDKSLDYVEKSAAIGYEIPRNINELLRYIITIRKAFHKELKARHVYSRGLIYLDAASKVTKNPFYDFDALLFCNFFFLHSTEQQVIKGVMDTGKGICLFQGAEEDWSVLKKNALFFGSPITPQKRTHSQQLFSLYQGFDIHSQVGIVRSILEQIDNKENTVIVVPRPETVIPLLTDIAGVLDEFNVSIGYPIKRTSVYTLWNLIVKVQESKKNDVYYTKDYLNLLRHPLVKNLKITADPAVTRVMIHKLEELLEGKEESSISGTLFLPLSQIEQEEKLYRNTVHTLHTMGIEAGPAQCQEILRCLHALFFRLWEEVTTFEGFASCLEKMIAELIDKSMLTAFPFNIKVVEKLQGLTEDLQSLLFGNEHFERSQLWEIFKQKLEGEVISFAGSPLRGTQILGLFETRSLDFENVIVMDMNESVLPKLKIYEPLIPREVMLSLGLNRLEKEEEIQRYQFMRLISSAKNVHLIYEETKVKEKSRFIEELLWRQQKEKIALEVMTIPKATFPVHPAAQQKIVEKTPEVVAFLKKQPYSASRLNTYLTCPLQFYFNYVLGLEEKEELLEDPRASHIGTFIHEHLERMFTLLLNKKPEITDEFRRLFFSELDKKFDADLALRMKADSILLRKIIRNRLERFLDNEAERDVAKILGLEEKRSGTMKILDNELQFVYTADRIDERGDGSIVIIDYKTGGADIAPKKLASLRNMEMERRAIKESLKSFQLPLYYYFVSQALPGRNINAELYNIRTLKRTAFISREDFPYRNELMEICLGAVTAIISELFDPRIPFEADKDERLCQYCPFTPLCT